MLYCLKSITTALFISRSQDAWCDDWPFFKLRIIGTFGGFVMHLLPGTLLIIIGGTAFVIAPLLFAIAPIGANYWPYIFPSMICGKVSADQSREACLKTDIRNRHNRHRYHI